MFPARGWPRTSHDCVSARGWPRASGDLDPSCTGKVVSVFAYDSLLKRLDTLRL
jgi:hypothetical protein